jgi:hypothetical protein
MNDTSPASRHRVGLSPTGDADRGSVVERPAMIPPKCVVCGRGDSGDPACSFHLMRFARTADDDAFERPGVTGMPPSAAWFCDAHVARAREYAHLPLVEALPKVRAFRLSEWFAERFGRRA